MAAMAIPPGPTGIRCRWTAAADAERRPTATCSPRPCCRTRTSRCSRWPLSLTREGRIANLELLHAEATGGNPRSAQREREILTLLDSISKARFEPARYGNAPVAVNMVWLYTQLTVRGKAPETVPPSRSISSVVRAIGLAA